VSRNGHFFVALSVGAVMVALDPDPPKVVLALGIVLGGSLPDQIELVVGYGLRGERYSLFRHRGFSHVPWPWMGLALLALRPEILAQFAGGLAIAALIHIAVNALSPSGIPLIIGGDRYSFGLRRNTAATAFVYRTGQADELLILLPVMAIAGVIVWTHAGAFTTLADWGLQEIRQFAFAH
jgi:membrane-bound metal-dependent hydrolase YbcI (DUF457 family)